MSGWIKLILMVFTMTGGFFFWYALAWVCIGLRLTRWAVVGLLTLAMVSEIGYVLWVRV